MKLLLSLLGWLSLAVMLGLALAYGLGALDKHTLHQGLLGGTLLWFIAPFVSRLNRQR